MDDSDSQQRDLLERLKFACITEMCSPEVLQYEQSMVDETSEVLRSIDQEKEAEAASQKEEEKTASDAQRIVSHIREVERERIKYLLALYHRSRLTKIEKTAMALAAATGEDRDSRASRLSPHELRFADGLARLNREHVRSSFLSRLPDDPAGAVRAMPQEVHLDEETDLDTFVFASVTEEVGSFQFGERIADIIDLKRGDIVVMRWRFLRPLIFQQKALVI